MHGVRPLRCCRAVTRPLVRQAAGGWHLSLRPTPAPQNLPTPLCLPACLPTPLPQALLALARGHTALLARFGAFLASILDHLEGFSDSQLRQVFDMFAALTTPAGGRPNRVRACVREGSLDSGQAWLQAPVLWASTAAEQCAPEVSGLREHRHVDACYGSTAHAQLPHRPLPAGGTSSSGMAGAPGGGRFEDELHITLTKALAHTRCAQCLIRPYLARASAALCWAAAMIIPRQLRHPCRVQAELAAAGRRPARTDPTQRASCAVPPCCPAEHPLPTARSPVYKRIGIVGGVAMLRREASAYAAAAEGHGPGDIGEGGRVHGGVTLRCHAIWCGA